MRAALVALLAPARCSALTEQYVRDNTDLLFANFRDAYGRKYANEAETALRQTVFTKNMLRAVELQKENPRATFGIGPFVDMTEEEFKPYHSLNVPEKPSPKPTYNATEVARALADGVDWRTKGAVTQVKDQKQCGSCWSFSTTGGIEGQWKLAGNKLTSLSEQELVSCDKKDQGCSGGLMDNAFEWLMSAKQGQLVTESSYPYTSGGGSNGNCESVASKPVGATITGHKDIAHDEDQMAAFVSASGPLSVAVDAGNNWQTYTGGILDAKCRFGLCRLDHGVLIVGYGADYWIVKNSWGPSWGESGYIRLKKGADTCGIKKSPSTSIV